MTIEYQIVITIRLVLFLDLLHYIFNGYVSGGFPTIILEEVLVRKQVDSY